MLMIWVTRFVRLMADRWLVSSGGLGLCGVWCLWFVCRVRWV